MLASEPSSPEALELWLSFRVYRAIPEGGTH